MRLSGMELHVTTPPQPAAAPGWGVARRARRWPLAAALAPLLAVALAACGTGAAGSPPTSAPATSATPPASSSTSTSTTTTLPGGQALAQPTASHPLTILEIGDSLGEDLGFGLGDVFGGNPLAHVVQDAVGDTGLARPDYYNWPAVLQRELAQYHPGLLIVFLGANDAQNFVQNGQYATFGDATWHRLYSTRVATVMSEALAAGAKVLWVGMPIMENPSFAQEMEQVNSIYAAEAATHPGVVYFPSWGVFSNSAGQYTGSIDGTVLRAPDGIHIANGGDDRLATALIAPIERDWGIRLTR